MEKLTALAWDMQDTKTSDAGPIRYRIMLIDRYVVVGVRHPGATQYEYATTERGNAALAQEYAVGYTANAERLGAVLYRGPKSRPIERDSRVTLDWLANLRTFVGFHTGLERTFKRTIRSGDELAA